MLFHDLLDTLGYEPGEYVSICRQAPGGVFTSEVRDWRDAPPRTDDGRNAWFGVNPTRERPVDEDGRQHGRGGIEDVTRLAAIWCDLDVKPGACRDVEHAHAVIDELSTILGTRPSAVVMSGNGLQPYWPIEDGQIEPTPAPTGDAERAAVESLRADAAALLKRWGRLACIVAEGMGAKIDRGVYDLARVLRIPGSFNLKDEANPKPVTITEDTGAPLSLDELRDRLDEHGVAEYEGDRRTAAAEIVSKPESWDYAPTTCDYFAPTIRAWQTEPITERHPWLMRVTVRLMAALRNGCLSAEEFPAARRMITDRFLAECAATGRDVPDFEIPCAFAWAANHVATKTDAELATEFGNHLHLWQRAEPRHIELAPPPAMPAAMPAAAEPKPPAESAPSAPTDGALAQVVDINTHRQQAQPATTMTLTDTGNADLLVDRWGPRLRYCPDTGKWLSWAGTRWEHGTDQGEAMVAAREVIESIRADEDTSPDLVKHKVRSLSRKSLENMVALAKCSPRMRVRIAQLDVAPYELNTPSGIIDLKTGELHPHNPDAWHTKITGAGYDPTQPTPMWDRFLATTFGGDPDMIAYVQRLAGYSMIGEVTHHVLPFLFGGGSNGKSVLMEVLTDILGDYAMSAPANFLLAGRDRHETEIARLHGARLVVCSEVNQGSKFDEAKVKLLTGGDTLTGRFMRADYFDFTPTHTLMLAGNHKPEVEGGGTSFWRRLQVLLFKYTVPEGERVEGLARQLVEQEGAGIMGWMAAGARAVMADGLCPPAPVRSATAEYAEQEDALARFLQECCVIDNDGQFTTRAVAIGGAFRSWAFANGEHEISSTKLGRELSTRFGVKSVKTRGGKEYRLRVVPEWLPVGSPSVQ